MQTAVQRFQRQAWTTSGRPFHLTRHRTNAGAGLERHRRGRHLKGMPVSPAISLLRQNTWRHRSHMSSRATVLRPPAGRQYTTVRLCTAWIHPRTVCPCFSSSAPSGCSGFGWHTIGSSRVTDNVGTTLSAVIVWVAHDMAVSGFEKQSVRMAKLRDVRRHKGPAPFVLPATDCEADALHDCGPPPSRLSRANARVSSTCLSASSWIHTRMGTKRCSSPTPSKT